MISLQKQKDMVYICGAEYLHSYYMLTCDLLSNHVLCCIVNV